MFDASAPETVARVTHPELSRLFARGSGTLPEICVVDVGATTRWISEALGPDTIASTWATIVHATTRAPRKFIWVAALPGGESPVFDVHTLASAVSHLRSTGITSLIQSKESVTSMLANESSILLHDPVSILSAQIGDYPEQLHVLDGHVVSVLDIATGINHTYWSQFRDRAGEPRFIAMVQSLIRVDPATGKPLGGQAAWKYAPQFDAAFRGEDDSASIGIPVYVLAQYWKHFDRVQERTRELIGARVDVSGRATLQHALPPPRPLITASSVPPLVIVPFETRQNGVLELGKAGGVSILGRSTRIQAPNAHSVKRMLTELSAANPQVWVAPRALDLLGYMHDNGIALPVKVIDPALCAYALSPDNIGQALSSCPSASTLDRGENDWLWDVKRKEAPPSNLDGLSVSLPDVLRELRVETARRGLDALIDDDIAPSVPVLAAMERRGAWVHGNSAAVWAKLQAAMSRYENQFRSLIGTTDPYEAKPKQLLDALNRRGIHLPASYMLPGDDEKNILERLAVHHAPVRSLLEARTISKIQEWLVRVENTEGRLRGRHLPEVTGRWGMNSWPLQGLPKHSRMAKVFRSLLRGPPGTQLVAADFSSFELRLIGGLSQDPLLLQAAQQLDAIGYLAGVFIGTPVDTAKRAAMKRRLHPLNYGVEEWGFVQGQRSISVAQAKGEYDQLRSDFGQLFAWRTQIVSALGRTGIARTVGGWQRDPRVAGLKGRQLTNAIVSTLVQGLAANILSWCLRELHHTLPAMGAELVFQNHDEIYVAASPKAIPHVSAEMRDVLERRVYASNLVPTNIKLVTKIRTGKTWAEIA